MNLNKAITEAVTKGVSRATRKPIANLRSDVAQLKRELAELKRVLKALQKPAAPQQEPAQAEAPSIRPTAKMVLKLRMRLGLTQAELAKLAGVSTLTVYKWEKAGGRIRMRGPALAGFARVRGMGKRGALKTLAETASS